MDTNTLISIQVPCHGRTYDLKKAFQSWVDSANASPPVEIVVLDYNSPDDLEEYMEYAKTIPLASGNSIVHAKYRGVNKTYHMAHARNLSVMASSGEYMFQISADSILSKDCIQVVRRIFTNSPDLGWITVKRNEGIMIMRKQDFIDAGGYDERFEFYSPEDKDLSARLMRRGLSKRSIDLRYVDIIFTPNEMKGLFYKGSPSKREMGQMMGPIYQENIANNVLVANEGKEWGQWI